MGLSAFIPELEDLRMRGKANATAALVALEEIISRGKLISKAIADFEIRTADVIAVPFREVLATVELIEDFIEAYFADLDFDPDLFVALRIAENALTDLHTLRRSFASQASATSGIQADVFHPGPNPLVPYRIRQGDTLERIALKHLGSSDRSWDIIDLNELVYPFIVTDPSVSELPDYRRGAYQEGEFLTGPPPFPPGVKITGQTIWLPSDAISVPSPISQSELDAELFGRDLKLEDGFLVFGPNGEFDTVEGIDNIVQALRQRIGTLKGELVLHPDLGMEQLLAVGIEGTEANVMVSGIVTARTVKQDPRVVQVEHVEVLFADTVNTADMTVKLIGPGDRQLPLNLVIPQTISRGGVGVVPSTAGS